MLFRLFTVVWRCCYCCCRTALGCLLFAPINAPARIAVRLKRFALCGCRHVPGSSEADARAASLFYQLHVLLAMRACFNRVINVAPYTAVHEGKMFSCSV